MRQRIEILPVAEQWLPEIAAIEAQAFPDPWSSRTLAAASADPNTWMRAALDEGRLVGYLIAQRTGPDWNLDDLAVVPEARRQGIAQQLLEALHSAFPESAILLEVRQSNLAARRLYEKLGYVQDGCRRRYYENPPEAAVLMRRTPALEERNASC